MSTTKSASTSLKLICILFFITSLVAIIGGLFLLMRAMEFGAVLMIFLGLWLMVIGLAYFVSVFGLWRLSYWGWRIITIGLWLGIGMNVIWLFTGNVGSIVGIIIGGVFLLYFYEKRELFAESNSEIKATIN